VEGVFLMIGKTLGHYRIGEQLGRGGMGEVYLADDLNLNRKVALKFLPDAFTGDPERMARFEREAKLLASLNHPNIAAIYGLEEAEGKRFLVLELVEGETLAQRLSKGPLPVEEALEVCRQIADGLEAAHEKGVIHRDLKPANVMITEGDKVKILDFGLAKALAGETQNVDASQSPTLTDAMTQRGMILGTAAYMSPEQAKGKAVDKRADIWGLGCILFECLTGKRAFEGETVTETLAAILKGEPNWQALPTAITPNICFVLRRCLEKDVNQRFRDAADIRIEIAEARNIGEAREPKKRSWVWLAWGIAAIFIVVSAALSLIYFRETASPMRVARFQIPPPEKSTWISFGLTGLLSPDGQQLALSSVGPDGISRLLVRPLDSLVSRPLAGTEGIQGCPIWSPDGRFIAFWVGGKLKKVAAAGGPPQTLCDGQNWVVGGFWTNDDKIVFGSIGGLRQVPAGGGSVTTLTNADITQGETGQFRPFPLPDGRHIVYGRHASNPEQRGIYVLSVDAKPGEPSVRRLLAGTSSAQFVPSPGSRTGYLLFLRESTLMAQPFDTERLELTGDAIPISGSGVSGDFSASTNGVLAYVEAENPGTTLTWLDRQGKVIGTTGEPQQYQELALSPDGSRLAVFRGDNIGDDLWLIELARGSKTRLTTDPANESYPVWSPDGKQIAFYSNRSGVGDLYRKSTDGSGDEELLLKSNEDKAPLDWSRDGRFILYVYSLTIGAQTDLWILPLDGKSKPAPYLATKFSESYGRFSPDGRWIVYVSNVSGQEEVYVSPFLTSMAANVMTMISAGGGSQPRWRRDGRELYYLSSNNQLMSVEVTIGPSFKAGVPKPLFEAPIQPSADPFGALWTWDVTADGHRFLVNEAPTGSNLSPLTVVLNWQAALKK
jgi:eukaryotic-like serine/threonine-protein kinase